MTEGSEEQQPDLEKRFRDLIAHCAPGVDGKDLYAVLADKYSETHRRYHTLDHIRHCLAQLDRARHLAADPDAIELAIWFHDAIYDSRADDNELRSAQMFDALLGVHLPGEQAERVHSLIMATVHPSEPAEPDHRMMVDIDLSSFGLPWDEFMRDTNDIRTECAHVPEDRFNQGKRKFLGALLARPRFYLTDYFHEHLESQARANIEAHLEDIERGA